MLERGPNWILNGNYEKCGQSPVFFWMRYNLNQHVHPALIQNSLAEQEPMYMFSFLHPVAIHVAQYTSK